jgi:hypothetical protein
MYGAIVGALSVVALMLAAEETSARSGGAARGGGAAMHPVSRPPVAHSFRHFRRGVVGPFWPVVGDFSSGSPGEPMMNFLPPTSNDVRYTYVYDVPWDWAHRFPPNVTPSDRPYVPSCSSETVTVPGRDAAEQTVNIMRCY